jgi:tight adherence protein C
MLDRNLMGAGIPDGKPSQTKTRQPAAGQTATGQTALEEPLAGRSFARKQDRGKRGENGRREHPAAVLTLHAMKKLRMLERISPGKSKLYEKTKVLYGSDQALRQTELLYARMVLAETAVLLLTLILLCLTADWATALLGGVLIAAVPFAMSKDLDRKIERRKRDIILELPHFLFQVTLLVNAGETIQQAVVKCLQQKRQETDHPFYAACIPAFSQFGYTVSFAKAMEELSRRCAVHEVSIFTSTVLLNYRRGSEDVVNALRTLSHQLWLQRKAAAKTLGEEAASKMVFPMVLIFFVTLLVVAAPAIFLMR